MSPSWLWEKRKPRKQPVHPSERKEGHCPGCAHSRGKTSKDLGEPIARETQGPGAEGPDCPYTSEVDRCPGTQGTWPPMPLCPCPGLPQVPSTTPSPPMPTPSTPTQAEAALWESGQSMVWELDKSGFES